jgi:serine/threonine protein kinase
MPINPGQVIRDRYRVVKLLAQGGMGAVYRAWDINLQKAVALKENLESAQASAKQFELEANLLANLSHPNLPRVTDYFFLPGQGQYLVMDFIEGEDLESKLDQQGRLSQPQALDWIIQVCSALEYLHGQQPPVIHRDIKPANIKVRPDGVAVLVDFGIAKRYSPGLGTTVGAKAVTPGYSPPEQYVGMTDVRTDVYALGATLYALLTGEAPPESAALAVNSLSLTPPRRLNPAISPGVEAAVLNAMQIHAERRFQSVRDLRLALTAQSQPPAVSPAVAATMAAPFVEQTIVAPQYGAPPQYGGQPQHGGQPQYGGQPQSGTSPQYAGKPQTASSRVWAPLLVIFLVFCLLGGGMGLLALYNLGAPLPTSTPAPAATYTSTPAPASPTQAPASPTSPPDLPASQAPPPTQAAPPTQAPPPTDIPLPPPTQPPADLGPPQLYLDMNYNCRGGPGSGYELIWTFESGLSLEIIGKEPGASWWLVRINDPRTRRQQCWIGGGLPSGDLEAVPYSDWTGTVDSAKIPWP